MKELSESDLVQIAEEITETIQDQFEDVRQRERLIIDKCFQFRRHPYMLNVTGEYEVEAQDDEGCKMTVLIESVSITMVSSGETKELDPKEIQQLINN